MTTDFMEELRRMPARSATLGRLLAVLVPSSTFREVRSKTWYAGRTRTPRILGRC